MTTPEAPPGETLPASWLSLPAATATNTPDSARAFTASSTACEAGPPSDMLATAFGPAFSATQSMPAMTSS